MTTNIQLFSDPRFGEMRITQTESGEPLFCLADLCSILELKNARQVRSRLYEKGVTNNDTPTKGGIQKITFVNEANLYRVVFQSRKPEAEQFQAWVCEEVLPAIRKNGGYILVNSNDSSSDLINKTLLILNETLKQQGEIIKSQAPKVLFADAVTTSDKSILIGELAKILNQNGINIGQNRFYIWLRRNGYLGVRGDYYNLPTQRSMELGLFEIKETTINQPGGKVLISRTAKATGKGQIYFLNRFLRNKSQSISAEQRS